MAKPKRKLTKPSKPTSRRKEEDWEEEPEEERAEEKEKPAGSTTGSFFGAIGAGIKAAGEAAERLARMGVNAASVEKLRLDLRTAQSKLGEAVLKCWDDAPNVGVMRTDPAVKEPLLEVKELRRRIRELEQRMAELKQAGKDS